MNRSVYHRLLRLRFYRPGAAMTFLYFEGSIVAAAVLSFAELVDWWSVAVIPAVVAALVKFNDVVAGLPYRSEITPRPAARGVARVRRQPPPE